MNIKRINELRAELAAERISYGELAEIDDAATLAGIKVTDEMLAGDTLDELERALVSKAESPNETNRPD